MSLAQVAIEKRAVTYFAVGLFTLAGIASFLALGQLEDPFFSIKNAVITTPYPGASPKEVELEITDKIEVALQELAQVDFVESWSMAGLSTVKVEIKAEFWSDRLPQVWDELRRKIRDIEATLPPGAGRPDVGDDFGDVFGHLLAVTGDGFNYAELEEYAKEIRKQLRVVEGVARVDLWGVQDKVIYVDAVESQLSELGLTDTSIQTTLEQQNMVVDGGSVDLQNRRMRIAPTGEFESPEDIGDLAIRASLGDEIGNLMASVSRGTSGKRSGELIRIRDIATVKRGYREPPFTLMRYNGLPALGLSITNQPGVNIVQMGRAVDARLAALQAELPVGIEVRHVHWQGDIVDASVKGFFINLAEAVAIVLVVLALSMGWRMGVIIGTALIVTILITFVFLAILGIDLQRMSLGALVIALGMMVDNSIVVADGFVVRLQKGMDRVQAGIEAASQPAWPLLGATVVAVMAFYPIYASTEGAGEYCRTLFTVVGISLMTSWLVSVTVTPLQCIDMLPAPKGDAGDPYAGGFYKGFRGVLSLAIRMRVITVAAMVALLVVAGASFGNVKQLFFPDSSMTKFMIDYWAPQGTRVQQVSADLRVLESKLLGDERVDSVASYIGSGPPRFYLPVEPESPNASYAHLVVNVKDFRQIDGMVAELTPWLAENMPQAAVPLRKFGVGPSNTWKLEVRLTGPADADPDVLRAIAQKGVEILNANPLAGYARTDWRQRTQRVAPLFNQERARWSTISRPDIANATKRAFDGRVIGTYREGDDLIPIVIRHVEEERQNVGALPSLQVQPPMATQTVPLAQVTDGVDVQWEDPILARRDRKRTLTIQSNPVPGYTLPQLRANVVEEFDALAAELPPGYELVWGGEYEDTVDSQASLIPGMIPAGAIIAFIVVALFNAFRPPLIILFAIPFALIGITAGLLGTGAAFGFVALLGAMSLAGMMIKNAIVLLDEVNANLALGKSPYDAVVDAAVSRLRPVVLAAATTVLGVIPLLQDVFWIGMAVTIMAGLTFGTVLTMVLVPVLYAIFYKIKSPSPA
jgi:multidrug efflux pump subunit AcrB